MSKFCGLLLALLDTALSKVPMVSWNIPYTTIYRKCPNSAKYQSSIFAVQGTELLNLVAILLHAP